MVVDGVVVGDCAGAVTTASEDLRASVGCVEASG